MSRRRRTIDTVTAIAAEIGAEPASVAVAWVAARGFVPVIGPRNAEQLAENLRATDVRLDKEQLRRLDAVSRRPAGYPYELL